jgi:hypothetical protein
MKNLLYTNNKEMKHKKVLQLASLLTIGGISSAIIVPLSLTETPPKQLAVTTTPGLVEWIQD